MLVAADISCSASIAFSLPLSMILLRRRIAFSEIAKRVKTFKKKYPDRNVISLGIGDVTQPLPKASVDAMVKAVEDMLLNL